MGKSFLERVQPSRQRWKLVDWPFPVDDEERPKVKVRVLGQNEAEAAYLATVDHFKGRKPLVQVDDPAFRAREHAEIVWRAFSADGEPLADTVDEMVKQPIAMLDELHTTWSQFQSDVASPVPTTKDMDTLVEHLKKSSRVDLLSALPSSWLIALITTLASLPAPSTMANEGG